MDMEKNKTISYYHAATFNYWELLWIFSKDYLKHAVVTFTAHTSACTSNINAAHTDVWDVMNSCI